MKIYELKNEFDGITNGDLIKFFKDKGYKVSSHTQNVTDEMIDLARDNFTKKEEAVEETFESKAEKTVASKKDISSEVKQLKTFKPDDMIPCRSVTPYKLIALGVDKNTVYNWNGYGDIDYLSYRDLQALRRTEYITKPMIVIDDADLCYQWRRELGDTYKYFLGVDYPEEFFDKSDSDFEKLLKNAPDVVKEVIKTTAINMIKNENFPTVQKIRLIDDVLGTCLKEFL